MPDDPIDDPEQLARARGTDTDAILQLTLALEVDAIGTFTVDAVRQTITWHRGGWRDVGMGGGTIALTRLGGFVGEQHMAALMEDMRAAADRGETHMRRSITVSAVRGQRRAIDLAGRYVYGADGGLLRIVGIVFRDPIADLRYHEALVEREQELQSILDTVPDPIIVADSRGIVRAFSQTAETLLNYAIADVVGRSVALVLADQWRTLFLTTTMDDPQIVKVARADGSALTVELRLGRIEHGGKPLFVLFLRDISARIAGEERLDALREEFAVTARTTAVGEFAAHLTHELNQPLMAITNFIGTAQELLRREASPARIAEMLDFAASQTLRASDTIHRMAQFTTCREIDVRPVSVAGAVEEAVALAIGSARQDLGLVLALDETAPTMFVDPTQINQVLANLLRNAAESMASAADTGDRTITIRSSRDGDLVKIAVCDTGPGIAAAIMPFLFEPFRSTKGGGGSGLGLAICRTIVQAHGGTMSAHNQDGSGACITFTVPAVAPTIEEVR